MTYSTGMMWILIGCLIVCGLYLFLFALMDTASKADDWADEYQWKLRRKIERDGQKQRNGARDRR